MQREHGEKIMFEILERYKEGKISEEEARKRIADLLYYRDEKFFLDFNRENKTGFPEIVFAEGKSVEDLLNITEKFLEKSKRVFISRAGKEKRDAVKEKFSKERIKEAGTILMVEREGRENRLEGKVCLITAGASDIDYAEECSLILEGFGIDIIKFYDAGIAGAHRPYMAIEKAKDADLLIVFAGMDGVLPGLIASLTSKPIIAVPIPTGYGMGGNGEGALITMLQSCVPGILVVNIGNSIGAAAGALRILGKNEKH